MIIQCAAVRSARNSSLTKLHNYVTLTWKQQQIMHTLLDHNIDLAKLWLILIRSAGVRTKADIQLINTCTISKEMPNDWNGMEINVQSECHVFSAMSWQTCHLLDVYNATKLRREQTEILRENGCLTYCDYVTDDKVCLLGYSITAGNLTSLAFGARSSTKLRATRLRGDTKILSYEIDAVNSDKAIGQYILYSFWTGNHVESNVKSLSGGSEVTRKLNSWESGGGDAPVSHSWRRQGLSVSPVLPRATNN